MKRITCRDLGGACDEVIKGNSFDEVGNNCRTHVMEHIKKGDRAHQAAVAAMQKASPEEQKAMMAGFKKKYDEAPNM